jgi:uncharacterized low-complexity protein
MVTTTFAAVVLSAALANTEATAPAWETSYARAAESAVAQRKPLAVFIGRGEAGYTRLVGGDMPTEAGRVLASNYVALYVNTETTEGQRLATAFGVNEGLVISSRCGRLQALKYGGPVPAVELAGYLTKYGAENVSVTTTETGGTAVAAAAPVVVGGCPNGRCGTVAPVSVVGGCPNGRCGAVAPAGYYTPAAPVYYGGFSSCPNGRCPNAR